MLYRIASLPAWFFYPSLLLWSVFYGSLAGALFKLLAVMENWWAVNRLQIVLWKKYPQRSYRKYIEGLWSEDLDEAPLELALDERRRLEQHHPREPFPMKRLLMNTLVMLFMLPLMVLSGLVQGPRYVFRRGCEYRQGSLRNTHNQALS